MFHENLLKKLYQQKTYEGVLILNEDGEHQYCYNFIEYFKFQEIPIIVVTGNKTEPYRNYFNNQILAIVCMSSYYYNILEQLAKILDYMRYIRIVVIMDQWTKELNAEELEDFFHYCHKLKMLNVVIIFRDFYKTRKYVQYTIFPEFKMEFDIYNPNSSDFYMLPERLQNLKGYKLRTIADHTEPRAMEYYNESNETVLNGYIGRFVQTISETLNSSLYFPLKVPPDVMLEYRDVMSYVVNYSIDIPVSSLSLYEFDDQRDFSYPFEIGKWCILLPMEKPLDYKELFLLILHSQIMLITMVLIVIFTMFFYLALGKKRCHYCLHRWPEIIINDTAIRGVLGQGFVSSVYSKLSLKLIYIMLMLSGLTISIIFDCYMLSFSTQLPSEPCINNYQDLEKSSLKLAIARPEITYLHNITNGSLSFLYSKLQTFSSFAEYSRFRDSLDRRFAYPTTTSKLYYYNGLESHYSKKFFRFSSNMCPNTMMQFEFPLGPNSYFIPRINEIILNTLQSGLIDYWMSKSYLDMVAAGKAIRVNITYPDYASPIYVLEKIE
ncbi:uncharacterized protein LOC119603586 [Lucilia sericata]|uniref:uncharacterized protein LOC119603586 n=1 Tax=Lucilia sericata TaxID=13632 RepID=UPI0018A84CD3|nr:uncharacterized protein LOC119603586 [Lucilia sericata]